MDSEEVTVTADAPLVETSQGRVSGLIEEDQVKDLPLIGRNFYNLVVLTPGVTGRATGGGQSYAQANADIYNNEFGVGMNANGARAESNNFMIDSATVSSSQRNGVVNINPNAESVEEVRVLVNNFNAEYGRNGSVLVNVITKSGNNDFHGSVGAYYTNDSLQSKNYFQEQTANFNIPEFGRKEFSWGFGGPIKKDKTFFFVSGDVLRSDVAVERAPDHPHPAVHPVHAAGAAEQHLDRHRPRLPRLLHPRPQLPHRRPDPRRELLGRRPRSAPRSAPSPATCR